MKGKKKPPRRQERQDRQDFELSPEGANPGNFTPFPKNPTICKFMIQIGRYEELGSGVRKVNQYLPHYAPGAGKPLFEDGDMFSVSVPLKAEIGEVAPQVTAQPESGPKPTRRSPGVSTLRRTPTRTAVSPGDIC